MFGYNDLIVDFRSIPVMKEFGFPVNMDVTSFFTTTKSIKWDWRKTIITGNNRKLE